MLLTECRHCGPCAHPSPFSKVNTAKIPCSMTCPAIWSTFIHSDSLLATLVARVFQFNLCLPRRNTVWFLCCWIWAAKIIRVEANHLCEIFRWCLVLLVICDRSVRLPNQVGLSHNTEFGLHPNGKRSWKVVITRKKYHKPSDWAQLWQWVTVLQQRVFSADLPGPTIT